MSFIKISILYLIVFKKIIKFNVNFLYNSYLSLGLYKYIHFFKIINLVTN